MPVKKSNEVLEVKIDSLSDLLRDHINNEDNSLNRLSDKIDKLDVRLDSMDVTLGKQQVSLDEHVKRTNLLEEKVVPIESQGKQLKLLVTVVKWAAIVAVAGTGVVGGALSIEKLISLLIGG